MSVRKRIWKSPAGEPREAWVVDYVDQHGDRHLKTFAKKRDADAHHAIVGTAVRSGVHTADSKSVTVAKAAELWLESCEAAGLERATLVAYRQHAKLHIEPILGALRLSQLTVPLVRGFEDRLRRDGRSGAMVRNVRRSLGAILADAQERGLVAQNVVYSLRKRQRSRRAEGTGKLNAGIDIPAPAEMRAIVGSLNPAAGRHGRCCSPRSSPGCGPPSCAACDGTMSTSNAASSTSANAPIATTRSDGRSPKPASARCRCRPWS